MVDKYRGILQEIHTGMGFTMDIAQAIAEAIEEGQSDEKKQGDEKKVYTYPTII